MLNILGLFVVGFLWGITNVFLERGSKDYGKEEEQVNAEIAVTEPKKKGRCSGLVALLRLLANWRFIVPFGINQGASAFYYYLLSFNSSLNSINPQV